MQIFYDLMQAIAARKAQDTQAEGSERKKSAACCTII